jgi:hypothetical protein
MITPYITPNRRPNTMSVPLAPQRPVVAPRVLNPPRIPRIPMNFHSNIQATFHGIQP